MVPKNTTVTAFKKIFVFLENCLGLHIQFNHMHKCFGKVKKKIYSQGLLHLNLASNINIFIDYRNQLEKKQDFIWSFLSGKLSLEILDWASCFFTASLNGFRIHQSLADT